ncbi:hypothetical protein FRC17_001742 [Serendipita sp. 399]|nr:hypothetical protein FRC17_001742 [Serendipita sp. 399]
MQSELSTTTQVAATMCQVSTVSLAEPKQLHTTTSSSPSVNLPRTSTHSSTKGRRRMRCSSSSAAATAKSPDQKLSNPPPPSFNNSSNSGIAKTVRRTLSGGLLSNIILRPFQPPPAPQQPQNPPLVAKAQPTTTSSLTTQPTSKITARAPPPNLPAPSSKLLRTDERENSHPHQTGLRKIRRKVSSTFARAIRGNEVNSNAGAATAAVSSPPPAMRPQGRHRSDKWMRARESVCSRNSTVSILEYLAARRRMEETTTLRDGKENLVPLSEYGRNCHLYGCDTPHVWNPDKNSSRVILHCDCDMNDLSPTHPHVEDGFVFDSSAASVLSHHHHPHPHRADDSDADDELSICETQLFYKPGDSTSTCVLDTVRDVSSVFSVQGDTNDMPGEEITNLSKSSLLVPSFERPCNPVALSASFSSLDLRL